MEAPQRRERRRLRVSVLGRPRATRAGATRDAVTGLMNGHAFRAVAAHALGRSTHAGEESVLLCCALEEVLEEGELARGRRIQEAARGLTAVTRGEDVLGRTGPLELCALMPGAGEDDAGLVAGRLAALELAIGWAGAPSRGQEVAALLEDARAGVERHLKLRGRGPILLEEGTMPSEGADDDRSSQRPR